MEEYMEDDDYQAAKTDEERLLLACRSGYLQEVKRLTKDGTTIQLEYKDPKDGRTPLHHAARWGFEHAMATLLKAGASHSPRDNSGQTPLMAAARGGFPGCVTRLLAAGASLDDVDQAGRYPIHFAAWGGEGVDEMLKHGANMEAKDGDGQTPLHTAAFFGKKEAVDVLLKNGADFNAKDGNGNLAHELAKMRGHLFLARRLKGLL